MSPEFEEKPYSDSHLDSPEYSKRLMRKLNTLIAVLEVACTKVRRSLAGPDPDVERLLRIQKNLNETLRVCVRAKQALERCEHVPKDLPLSLSQVADDAGLELPDGSNRPMVEMSSSGEQQKFDELGPIDPREIRSCDLDELCRRLLGD